MEFGLRGKGLCKCVRKPRLDMGTAIGTHGEKGSIVTDDAVIVEAEILNNDMGLAYLLMSIYPTWKAANGEKIVPGKGLKVVIDYFLAISKDLIDAKLSKMRPTWKGRIYYCLLEQEF